MYILQISGSDADNYPLTRKVQRDLWLHQHPQNCHDPSVKFLVTDWETLPGFGIGAQFAGMCGLLAIAIKEKRVLVTNYYNRADHDGCKGMLSCHNLMHGCLGYTIKLQCRSEYILPNKFMFYYLVVNLNQENLSSESFICIVILKCVCP